VPKHRKKRKFRSTGRHAAPSQIEAVAQRAGKAVPAVAMVGALAVASPAPVSPGPARTAPVAGQVTHSPVDAAIQPVRLASAARLEHTRREHARRKHARREHAAQPGYPDRAGSPERHAGPNRAYRVQPGDTLSGIAYQFYGQARAWTWLYQVNREQISSPNRIFPGQVLRIPPAPSQPVLTSARQGTLGCSGLEALWRSAGGAPRAAVTAASVAMAESAGNQYATGRYGERGYWQINPNHGALSTYDAYGNARAAIIISGDGTNWSPWTTFVDGAYAGRC
jgi:hypothetical protein